MIETLTAGMPPVDLQPGTVRGEVLQNVACILATRRGSVPYDRTLGIKQDWIDDPTPAAKARAVADIVQAIHEREPRARVESVEFTADTAGAMEGALRPVVRLSINEGGI